MGGLRQDGPTWAWVGGGEVVRWEEVHSGERERVSEVVPTDTLENGGCEASERRKLSRTLN